MCSFIIALTRTWQLKICYNGSSVNDESFYQNQIFLKLDLGYNIFHYKIKSNRSKKVTALTPVDVEGWKWCFFYYPLIIDIETTFFFSFYCFFIMIYPLSLTQPQQIRALTRAKEM